MADHRAARQIVLEAWARQFPDLREPSLNAVQLAQAMMLHETGYGQYKPFPGSNNFGAIQGCKPNPDGVTCPCKGFVAGDSRPNPDGTSTGYAICFKSYDTPVEGAMDVLRIIGPEKRPKVFASLDTGDVTAFSTAMYDSGYYQGFGATREQRIAGHVKAMEGKVKLVAEGMGEPIVAVPGGSPPRRLDGSMVAIGAASPLAWGAKFIALASVTFLAFQGGKILGEKL